MTETTPAYTDRLFTKPQEHTLYPRPEHVYECSYCAANGYHYPATGEVFAYHTCVRRSGHVWVYEGTMQTEGTGIRVFEVSDSDIRALRDEALAAGDFEQAALCEAALSGAHVHPGEAGRAYADARQKCIGVILDARMRAAEDEDISEEKLDEQATPDSRRDRPGRPVDSRRERGHSRPREGHPLRRCEVRRSAEHRQLRRIPPRGAHPVIPCCAGRCCYTADPGRRPVMTETAPLQRIDLTAPSESLTYAEILTPAGVVRVNTNLIDWRTKRPVVVVEVEQGFPSGEWDIRRADRISRFDVTLTKSAPEPEVPAPGDGSEEEGP